MAWLDYQISHHLDHTPFSVRDRLDMSQKIERVSLDYISLKILDRYSMINKEYIESIKKKLDALNKAAGINPEQQKVMNQLDPQNFDVFDALGQSAIKYLKSKENKTLE
jgi:hypothetical protein